MRSLVLFLALLVGLTTPAAAGRVFVTGHDPDFHASLTSENPTGAQNILRRSLAWVRDGDTRPILFIKSNLDNLSHPWGHGDSELGLLASGYTEGMGPGDNYVKVTATEYATVNLSDYSAVLIPSDYGGILTGDDLAAINARTQDILGYLNAGGGLVALSEYGPERRTPVSIGPEPADFGFLPFLPPSFSPEQGTWETAVTVTEFGTALGLTESDVNGNAYHVHFAEAGGLQIVDVDGTRILSLAYEGLVPPGTIGVESTTWSDVKSLFRSREGKP